MVWGSGSGNVSDIILVSSFDDNVTTQPAETVFSNYVIPIRAISASQCTAGYYCTPNSTEQIICPPGYYCPAGSTAPLACPPATYCPEGAKVTSPCSAGHYCPAKSWAHTLCPIGFYCSANTETQTKCRPGYFCPEGAMSETPCPPGYYCPEGTDLPVECSDGNMCPAALLSTQTPCPDGSYSYAKAKACTPCLEPPNGTVTELCQLVCNDGYVKIGWRCLPPFQFTGSNQGVRTCPACYTMNGSMCTLSLT